MKYLILLSLLSVQAHAKNKGYLEALEYFKYRKKYINKNTEPTDTKEVFSDKDSSSERGTKERKFFLTLGYESSKDKNNSYLVQGGVAFLRSKYLQQNLLLEWAHGNKSDQDKVTFLHGVHLSSDMFFMSPELALGAGRVFGDQGGKGFATLKFGVGFYNRWSRKVLLSFSLYYRRDQMFRNSEHEDLYGLNLKIGI